MGGREIKVLRVAEVPVGVVDHVAEGPCEQTVEGDCERVVRRFAEHVLVQGLVRRCRAQSTTALQLLHFSTFTLDQIALLCFSSSLHLFIWTSDADARKRNHFSSQQLISYIYSISYMFIYDNHLLSDQKLSKS